MSEELKEEDWDLETLWDLKRFLGMILEGSFMMGCCCREKK